MPSGGSITTISAISAARAPLRRASAALVLVAALAGCTQREPVAANDGPGIPIRTPQERSYLDPGPAPSEGSGPAYVRENRRSPNFGDRFGGDVLSRAPY